MEINELVRTVFLEANAQNLTYCHWKSNIHLDKALRGDEDLDVLIAPKDFKKLMVAFCKLFTIWTVRKLNKQISPLVVYKKIRVKENRSQTKN